MTKMTMAELQALVEDLRRDIDDVEFFLVRITKDLELLAEDCGAIEAGITNLEHGLQRTD